MSMKKLILLQNENKFYLSVPEEIYIGKYKEDVEGNIIVSDYKYHYFVKDKDISYTENFNNIGYANFDNSVNILLLKDDIIVIPCGTFGLHKDNFNKLRKVFKNYDYAFKVELVEYYSNDSYKLDKIKIEYEIIKLENPNSRYGNISEGKINLINYNGYIPKNIDFIISEEYAKRLDELFKSWNNENIRSKKIKLIEYLFKTYNDVKSYKDNYFVSVDDKITVLVDVENLEILEFKSLYYNNNMKSYNKLVSCVNNIQKEIDKINEKSVYNV